MAKINLIFLCLTEQNYINIQASNSRQFRKKKKKDHFLVTGTQRIILERPFKPRPVYQKAVHLRTFEVFFLKDRLFFKVSAFVVETLLL